MEKNTTKTRVLTFSEKRNFYRDFRCDECMRITGDVTLCPYCGSLLHEVRNL